MRNNCHLKSIRLYKKRNKISNDKFIFALQLSEIVNSISPQGQLPLGIALMGRSTAIAQTLVQTGKADVNAYNAEVR